MVWAETSERRPVRERGGVARLPEAPVVFELDDLSVSFVRKQFPFRTLKSPVLDKVNLRVRAGETVGIQGASGAGKSTLARAAVGLNPLASGRVLLYGSDILAMSASELRQERRRIQLVLQNTSSLSPYHRVRDILVEPLRNFGFDQTDWAPRVEAVMQQMSLAPDLAGRYPTQLSGGQQQRVSIARALIVEPNVVLLDEPVSSLDRGVQLEVLDDLKARQDDQALTLVVITHDRKIASYMCDEIYTIANGRIG